MRNSKNNTTTDLEKCKAKIDAILQDYNCSIETDDYCLARLRDNDTNETIVIERG